jgi:hypothetical protein
MSMSEDTENFEQLRRLLALKRFEQPPPGYFNNFSRHVILRIEAGERGEEVRFLDQFSWDAPWLQRIWAALETQPVLAGAFGMALCGFLIAGVVFADNGDSGANPSFANVSIPQADPSPLLTRVALQPSGANAIGSPAKTDEMLLRALGTLQVEAQPASLSFGSVR